MSHFEPGAEPINTVLQVSKPFPSIHAIQDFKIPLTPASSSFGAAAVRISNERFHIVIEP